MKILSVMSVTAAVLSISNMAFSATAIPSAAPDQKKEVETIVHDYLLQNPETIIQSLQGYQQKQMVEQTKKFQKIQSSAPKYANELFHQATDPVAGNPNGALTLVEFFDYQCPHCVEMTPVVEELIKSYPNLRVVFK
jgi:protein-disulfide isomerase